MTAQIISFIPQDAITLSHNQLRTTSIKIADAFGKRHTHILEKIQNLNCSPEFTSANFSADVQMVDIGQGAKRESKIYEMTKDGFMFLVMGFNGKKAAAIKEAYINAFNQMAEQLAAQTIKTKTALPGGLLLEQQDAIKALVKSRVESLPHDKQGAAARKAWGALKSKFGVSYKEIPPEHFTEALSLVARLPLEGEYLPATPDKDASEILLALDERSAALPPDIAHAADAKAFELAAQALPLFAEHVRRRVVVYSGMSKDFALNQIAQVTLSNAITYQQHQSLKLIQRQVEQAAVMAKTLHEQISQVI